MVLSEFLDSMAAVPSPVVVATTLDASGRRWGFTASSFTALSADPPLILVCLDRSASTHAAFTACDRFMANVLAAEHEPVARRFASSGIDRFAAGDMTACEAGLPGLPGAVARLTCTLHAVLDGGDHSILVGRVEQCVVSPRTPLVYCGRSYTRPAMEAASV